jgi:hypothetical protein
LVLEEGDEGEGAEKKAGWVLVYIIYLIRL